MTKRRRLRVWMMPKIRIRSGRLLLSACFVLGSMVGVLLVCRLGSGGESAVNSYLNEWASTLSQQSGAGTSWLSDLLRHFRFPAAVLFLGFVPLGVFGIPIAFFLRGMLISFTASSFLKMYAYRGMLAAVLLYGPAEVAEILVLFALGTASFQAARHLAFGLGSGKGKKPQKEHEVPAIFYALALAAVSLVQSALSPWTLGAISRLLL